MYSCDIHHSVSHQIIQQNCVWLVNLSHVLYGSSRFQESHCALLFTRSEEVNQAYCAFVKLHQLASLSFFF